jgi:hypothetical protein
LRSDSHAKRCMGATSIIVSHVMWKKLLPSPGLCLFCCPGVVAAEDVRWFTQRVCTSICAWKKTTLLPFHYVAGGAMRRLLNFEDARRGAWYVQSIWWVLSEYYAILDNFSDRVGGWVRVRACMKSWL